ncbi:MAG: hypothetical protein U1E17_22325 [Geminicoccaceae bacterium]
MRLPGMLGHGLLAPDEVQASSILSADGQEVSVLLSGLRVALAADAGSARRSFGFELATRPPDLPPRVVVQMRGGTVLGTGTRAYLLATFAGRAGLVEVKADDAGDFLVELGIDWPRGGGLLGRIVLLLARDARAAAEPASLALDSIDLAAEPA